MILFLRHSVTVSIVLCLCAIQVTSIDFCSSVNQCNGNGFCNTVKTRCECYDGYGSFAEKFTGFLLYSIASDCSQKTCPLGGSWVGYPFPNKHYLEPLFSDLKECSNVGNCDRETGKCNCFNGFRGPACQRKGCDSTINNKLCSGLGKCLSLYQLSKDKTSQPLSDPSSSFVYKNNETMGVWDADNVYGCLCESTWKVGFEAGEKQVSEYFEIDCSKKRCPSGDDPMTEIDETDCENKIQNNENLTIIEGIGMGKPGNICHVECANRGICNHNNGQCQCFTGYTGLACETQDARAIGL